MIKAELNVCPNYKSCLAQRVTRLENDACPDCISCDLHRSYSLGFQEGVKQAVDAMTYERRQTMSDLISREALKNDIDFQYICKCCHNVNGNVCDICPVSEIEKKIDNAPTVDTNCPPL